MGVCYSVTLDVCVLDEQGAIKALNEKIKTDKRTDYSLKEYAKQGITTETFDDLIRIFLAGWRGQEVNITVNDDGTTTYSNAFDASYGWESVMIEMFETLTPYIREDSELCIYPDSGRCEVTIQNGEVKTEYIYESCTYKCIICGEEFYCEDDEDFECNVEEELWGHLQMEHEEEFEKVEDWETPYMLKAYYEREDD